MTLYQRKVKEYTDIDKYYKNILNKYYIYIFKGSINIFK